MTAGSSPSHTHAADAVEASLRDEIEYREAAAVRAWQHDDKAMAAYHRNFRSGVIMALHIVQAAAVPAAQPEPEPRELLCQRCDREYVTWFAPNPLWNAAIRAYGGDSAGHDHFLCLSCFAALAEMRGVKTGVWVLTDETTGHDQAAALAYTLRELAQQAEAALEEYRNGPARVEGSRAERITHGRHCICSACAREDWTRPELAACGMHGPSCPPVYAPLGAPGSYVPAPAVGAAEEEKRDG